MDNVVKVLSRDPVMKKLIRKHGELTLTGLEPQDYFGALARSIIGQQLSGKAAQTITGRVLALMGGSFGPKKILKLSDEILRQAGMSYNKINYMKNLSQAALDKTLNLKNIHSYTDEEVLQQITAIKGLGNWTAEMFMIFTLARQDVYSMGDGALTRAINNLYGKDKPLSKEDIKAVTGKWKPFRSFACLYLWRSLEK